MVRTSPTTFFRDTIRTLGVLLIGLFLLVFSTWLANVSFKWVFIDLQSVSVPHHRVADDPNIEVWRVIRSDFHGRWSVTIRDAKTHRYICTTPGPSDEPSDTLLYRASATADNPTRPKLSYWIRDQDALDECIERGFGEGSFYITTCHTAHIAVLFPVTRCRDSNVFTRSVRGPKYPPARR